MPPCKGSTGRKRVSWHLLHAQSCSHALRGPCCTGWLAPAMSPDAHTRVPQVGRLGAIAVEGEAPVHDWKLYLVRGRLGCAH